MTTLTASIPAETSADHRADESARDAVRGVPRMLLRLEAALVFALAIAAYAHLGGGWGLFAALFLVPDLSMVGYLVSARAGAIAYNAGHSYLGPALLAGLGLALGVQALVLTALIWVAHVGFDRMLGYGLKYASRFGATHLGQLGRAPRG